MSADLYIVIAAYNGNIAETTIFADEGEAIGFAHSKYKYRDSKRDDVAVYALYSDDMEMLPIYYVEMEGENLYEEEEEEDIGGEYDFLDAAKPKAKNRRIQHKKPKKFTLVDVDEAQYNKVPSLTRRKKVKKGDFVQVEVSTSDSYEKLWLQVEKLLQKKARKRFEGVILSEPDTFEPPQDMRIRFTIENIIDIE